MLAINARTGMPIVDNIERNGFSDRTSFTEAEYKKIQETEDTIILVHNHSYNRPPSGRDIVSYALDDQIRMSLVLCHDGDVYAIMRAQKVIADMYEKAYNAYKETYDINMAKTLATKLLYDFNESGKLFEVRRL